MWINGYGNEKPGAIGFLVERFYSNWGGTTITTLEPLPARTNVSHEPRLRGWCGETNNVSVDAVGLGVVVKRSERDPFRVLVRQIADDDPQVANLRAELGI